MASFPAGPLDSRRRPTAERRTVITAAVLAAFLLSATVACSSEDPGELDAAGTTTTITSTSRTTTTTAAPVVKVAEVVDARTITVSGGGRVQLTGLAQPGECWAGAAVDFLKNTLVGKDLRVVGGTVLLPDGVDFAVHALSQGMARADQAASAALTSAQDVAKFAGLGLWGAPCAGADTVAPPPPPAPTYNPPAPQPVQPAPQPQPQPEPPASAYYANCAAARAAGKAPLYAGQPGYRAALDRDRDGVACE